MTQITDEIIAEMEAHVMDINYAKAEAKEKETRHDVMAHVHVYGEVCPKVSTPRCEGC
jgi:adenylosuccinate lyase